jgi:hypothetical protein
VEWLEKAANQNIPLAMNWLGDWFRNDGGDKQKAVSYFRAASELGWKGSMPALAEMLRDGEGCAKDLREAVIWGAQAPEWFMFGSYIFGDLLADARRALESGATEKLDCDCYQLCYSLGWGLYWYLYDTRRWKNHNDEDQAFGNRCIDYYCSCVYLQQKSIFTFLLCWNQTTRGVKGPGQMIAQIVWSAREDNLVKPFELSGGKEPKTKRIKK